MAPPPAHNGQGFQQAPQACALHGALQGRAGPADGVPPAGKVGPQPKAQGAGPSVVASTAAKKKALEKKKKPKKKSIYEEEEDAVKW